jgi:hypothetical protein
VVLDVIDRRAEAAAVSAMASGSQHRTIKAMSHRMACSESTPESISSATTGSVPRRHSASRACAQSRTRVPEIRPPQPGLAMPTR